MNYEKSKMMKSALSLFLFLFATCFLYAQDFYFGADLSYVNEMEDCGVTYLEDQNEKDIYSIFEDNGCNLVRLRLWHTPKWYDALNNGNRYSDLNDVKKSISRAKAANQNVLLDFHLSDNWADPSKQLVPSAWLSVVEDTSILKDSLYNYIYSTLAELHDENVLPDMVQIGNETNKGILLSPTDNQVWTLDWDRNAILFNSAIKAVRAIEAIYNTKIQIMLHVAGPTNAEWLIDGFIDHGVTDFDIIGLSYYWAWHKPTTIKDAGEIIQNLKSFYPNKDVIIVETGYIWTTEWNDNASNIISETHPDYHPASPEAQKNWLIELTKEVIKSNGSGVVYWEPAWVSSSCYTQWGQGSHQEHATFFDFDNNLLKPGGIDFMNFNYGISNTNETIPKDPPSVQLLVNTFSGQITIKQGFPEVQELTYTISDTTGRIIQTNSFKTKQLDLQLDTMPKGTYVISVFNSQKAFASKVFLLGHE